MVDQCTDGEVAVVRIRIERGVPYPAVSGRSFLYPFSQMLVGDSFAVPAGKYASVRVLSAKVAGMRFSVRKTKGGYRCWRVE